MLALAVRALPATRSSRPSTASGRSCASCSSQLGFNIDHSKLVGLIQHALTLSASALTLLAIGLAAYAAIEVVEGVGLWLARRWGEYFAMVATSLGLP